MTKSRLRLGSLSGVSESRSIRLSPLYTGLFLTKGGVRCSVYAPAFGHDDARGICAYDGAYEYDIRVLREAVTGY